MIEVLGRSGLHVSPQAFVGSRTANSPRQNTPMISSPGHPAGFRRPACEHTGLAGFFLA